MAEERHQIIVEARGGDDVDRLNRKVKEQEDSLNSLRAAQASAAAEQGQLSAAISETVNRLESLRREADQARTSLDALRNASAQLAGAEQTVQIAVSPVVQSSPRPAPVVVPDVG